MEYYKQSSDLYHHGVKGMKWGIRKKYNDAVKKFTNSKIGSRYKLKDDPEEEAREVEGNSNKTTRIRMSSKAKKAIKIGGIAAGVTLAAYGGYKVNDYLNSCTYTLNGKSVSRKEFSTAIKTMVNAMS